MIGVERVHEILETLIRFDTVSARSNMALIHWVRDYLLRHGIDDVNDLVFAVKPH